MASAPLAGTESFKPGARGLTGVKAVSRTSAVSRSLYRNPQLGLSLGNVLLLMRYAIEACPHPMTRAQLEVLHDELARLHRKDVTDGLTDSEASAARATQARLNDMLNYLRYSRQ